VQPLYRENERRTAGLPDLTLNDLIHRFPDDDTA
jgi:hypothetical protein